ncbi:MAG TPA: ammonia-forming cytochrome c nitrite reductase subunit c552 [Acidobacteriota bacterium]|nr:ammonia-forming cytochrome c nitrite reductase subunit c552 [Acidobacteriota bacterium]
MKGLRHAALALTAVIAVAAFIGCEGEEGPQGPPGLATCTETCHTDSYAVDDYLLAYQTEYEGSGHANGESFARGGEDCARCHTSEGFTHFVTTGEEIEVVESSPIGCFGCHAPHTNQDFSLRRTSAVDLDWGGTYNKLESNTCATCHQARLPDPLIDDLATAITSTRWGPHHGPQSGVLIGDGAYVFDEAYSSSHAHNAVSNGCVGCHMAETAGDGLGGGHTFSVGYEYHSSHTINGNGCFGCHTAWDEDDDNATEAVADAKAEFEEAMDALLADFVTLGWLSSSGSVQGSAIPADVDARGAVFNFKFIEEDLSMGVHNPTYAGDVLEATQAYVDQQLILAGR